MRLVTDGRARRLLRRLPTVNLYSATELVLLVLLAAAGARLIWTIVTPVGPLGEWRPAAPVVAGIPADTLRQRPDVRQAERALAAATARIVSASQP